MAEATPDQVTAAEDMPRRRPLRHLEPLWEQTFREPIREGRLRLGGLGRTDRQLARAGLVAVGLVLVSGLAAATWRRGPTTPVVADAGTLFVPVGVIAVTLVCFALAWSLVVWGALEAAPLVRAGVALVYLLVNAPLCYNVTGTLSGPAFHDSWFLRHAVTILLAGYYVPFGALLLSALVTLLGGRRDRLVRPLRLLQWVLRLVCVAGLAVFFIGQLRLHRDLLHTLGASGLPSALSTAITQALSVLLPLIYITAVAVADFALDVSTSATAPATGGSVRWLRPALLALVAVKLWFEVGARWDYWSVFARAQTVTVVRSAVVALGLAALVVVVTRFRRSQDTEAAEEALTYGGAMVVAAVFLLQMAWAGLGVLALAILHTSAITDSVGDLPAGWLNTWGLAIAAGVAVMAGIWLMRRSDGGLGDEIGSGLIVVGAWNAVNGTLANSGLQLGLSFETLDVAVTLAVLAVVLVRWRRLDSRQSLALFTAVVFTWLVSSQGDYISYLGSLLGLPAAIVVVVGIGWTLLSGSAFASASSRRLPQASRALLYVGYLLISATILDWQLTTHDTSSASDQLVGYYFLGIPIAAWLLGRAVLTRDDAGSDDVSPVASEGPGPGDRANVSHEDPDPAQTR